MPFISKLFILYLCSKNVIINYICYILLGILGAWFTQITHSYILTPDTQHFPTLIPQMYKIQLHLLTSEVGWCKNVLNCLGCNHLSRTYKFTMRLIALITPFIEPCNLLILRQDILYLFYFYVECPNIIMSTTDINKHLMFLQSLN